MNAWGSDQPPPPAPAWRRPAEPPAPLPPYPPLPPRRAKRPRRRGWFFLALFVGGLAFLALRRTEFYQDRFGRLPPRQTQTRREKYAKLAAAFNGRTPPPDNEDVRAIGALIDDFRRVTTGGDKQALLELFDLTRMKREARRLDALAKLPLEDRSSYVKSISGDLADTWRHFGANVGWQGQRLVCVDFLAEGREAVAYAALRTTRPDEVTLYFRWWVRRSGDRWRIYDFENLDFGVREIAGYGQHLQAVAAGAEPKFDKFLETVEKAAKAADEGKLPALQADLEALDTTLLHPQMQARGEYWLGRLLADQGRYAEAVERLDKAEALYDTMPLIAYYRARVHGLAGDHAAACKDLQDYIDLFAGDAETFNRLGTALAALERKDEAADAFRRGLADNPTYLANLFELAGVLGEDRQDEIGEHFAKLPSPDKHFDQVASRLYRRGCGRALEAVIDAYEKARPDDPLLGYYAAAVRVVRKQYRPAAELFLAACKGLKDETVRAKCRAEYLWCMSRVKAHAEAYRRSPDRPEAFRILARNLAGDEDAAALGALIAEHARACPADVWVHYYTGEMHLLKQQYAEAQKAYARGLAAKLPEKDREEFRVSAVYAMYKAGRGLEAYESIAPTAATLRQLVHLAWRDKDADVLAGLAEAHGRACPADAGLPILRARAAFLRHRYADVVRLLRGGDWKAMLDAAPAAWEVEDLMIRSLLRLGRFDDALSCAESSTRRDGDPWFEAVVHAATGNVERAIRSMQACAARGNSPGELYADPDAGANLKEVSNPATSGLEPRADAFAPFRRLFPEPQAASAPASQEAAQPATGPGSPGPEPP